MGAAVVVGWVAAACSGGDAAHLGSGRECSSIQGPLQGQNLPEMSAVLFFKESLILYGPYTRLPKKLKHHYGEFFFLSHEGEGVVLHTYTTFMTQNPHEQPR